MAERGARLLLSLFCLTITLSHADKGKSEIKEHSNFLRCDPLPVSLQCEMSVCDYFHLN